MFGHHEALIHLQLYLKYRFNSLTGIIFVWTDWAISEIISHFRSFNSLTGIIFVWTYLDYIRLDSDDFLIVSIPLRELFLFGRGNKEPGCSLNLILIVSIPLRELFLFGRLMNRLQTLQHQPGFNSLTGIIFVWTAAPLKPCKSRTPEAICEHLRNCDCFLTVSGNFSAR